MTNRSREIPDERPLTSSEREVIRWLLEHGGPEATIYLAELDNLAVVSRCPCGCPSINFTETGTGGMQILSDAQFDDPDGGLNGAFVFAVDDKLAGLEIWSIDGASDFRKLPEVGSLSVLEFS